MRREKSATELSHSLLRVDPHGPTRYISQGRSVLAMDPDGFVCAQRQQGLWVRQTRLLRRLRWLLNGRAPIPAGNSVLEQATWLGYYLARPRNWRELGATSSGGTQQSIELRLRRSVQQGLAETAEITNWTQVRTLVRVSLEFEPDFADPAEAGARRRQRGRLRRAWSQLGSGRYRLAIDYRAVHRYRHQGDTGLARVERGLVLELSLPPGSAAHRRADRIDVSLRLPPGAKARIEARWISVVEHEEQRPRTSPSPVRHRAAPSPDRALKLSVAGRSELAAVVEQAFERARRDLGSLRLADLDRGPDAWTVAGGVPLFVAFFGRDSLLASSQSLLLGPEIARGTLAVHAKWQATERDDWRDEQPGRLIHEVHTNPLSVLGFDPHGRYYGDITAPMLFPILLDELWRWTGDAQAVRPYVDTALRALRWADENGDSDGDGFYEFQTRSLQGAKNQIWKDSDDAIVYPDGSQVADPIASCETQGYAYAAKVAMANVLQAMGDAEQARVFAEAAAALKRRFNDVFWLEREGTFAMGLDRSKRLIATIASDPGHCLATGIVDRGRARALAARLMKPDLFSGWGIRTLSDRHPAYDPFSYHRGTVWPVENAVIARGLGRFRFHSHLHRLARAQFEAAALFPGRRLPELFGGHQRDLEHPFPGLYPPANAPQAWSGSAVVSLLQSLLGLAPLAPKHVLFVDPLLPDWLPELTLRDLRVGRATVSLRFRRTGTGGQTRVEIESLAGRLKVVRRPRPW
jgi:glycogen debranching enzyme